MIIQSPNMTSIRWMGWNHQSSHLTRPWASVVVLPCLRSSSQWVWGTLKLRTTCMHMWSMVKPRVYLVPHFFAGWILIPAIFAAQMLFPHLWCFNHFNPHVHWIGERESLQETLFFTIKYGGFLFCLVLKPMQSNFSGVQSPFLVVPWIPMRFVPENLDTTIFDEWNPHFFLVQSLFMMMKCLLHQHVYLRNPRNYHENQHCLA